MRAVTAFEWTASGLLIGYATDLPKIVIDVFALPVPQPAFPLLLPFLLVLIGAYGAALGSWRLGSAGPMVDSAYLATMVIWAGLEVWQGTEARLTLVGQGLYVFLIYYAARQHISLFGPGRLTIAALGAIAALATAHLVALLLSDLTVFIPLLDMAEVHSRNGISWLVVAFAFLAFFVMEWRLWSPAGIATLAFSAAQLYLNTARGAAIVFVALVLARLMPPALVYQTRFLLRCGIIAAAVATFAAFPLAKSVGYFDVDRPVDGSDTELSAFYRTATNWKLVHQVLQEPVAGSGYGIIDGLRSGGYISHTYLLFPLAAYGMAGAIPFFCVVCLAIAGMALPVLGRTAFAFTMMGAALFANEILLWIGLLAGAFSGGAMTAVVQGDRPRAAHRYSPA